LPDNRGEHRSIKLQLMVSASELRAIDEWRFRQRLGSRAHAVRILVRRGLGAEGDTGDGPQG
jgi:hypothetical protein